MDVSGAANFSVQIVDDDPDDRMLIRNALETLGIAPERIGEHGSVSALLAYLESATGLQLVLHDYNLGGETVTAQLPSIVKACMGPIVILTGRGDEEAAARCIQAGAADYLVKSHALEEPEALRRSLEKAVDQYFELRNRETCYKELEARTARLSEICEMSQAFVDNVSHEFRTPLAVLKELNALLLDAIPGDINDTQREYLEIMATKIDDLAIMVNDLLDSSRIENNLLGVARQPCTIDEVVEAVCATLARRATVHKIDLQTELQIGLPQIYCDPEKLSRIITNLVVNAMKFSPEGSTVEIRTSHCPDRADMIRVSVVDHGQGIAAEDLKEIFERFKQVGASRTAARGFGLGLSIVRDLLRLNLCDIDVISEPGQGSTFSVLVPKYDIETLLPQYLDRLEQLGAHSFNVAAILVRIDAANLEVAQDAVHSINRALRPVDLLLPGSEDGSWIVLTTGRDAQAASDSIQSGVAADFQGMMTANIPTISFSTLGTWHADEQRDELMAACDAALATSTRVEVYV